MRFGFRFLRGPATGPENWHRAVQNPRECPEPAEPRAESSASAPARVNGGSRPGRHACRTPRWEVPKRSSEFLEKHLLGFHGCRLARAVDTSRQANEAFGHDRSLCGSPVLCIALRGFGRDGVQLFERSLLLRPVGLLLVRRLRMYDGHRACRPQLHWASELRGGDRVHVLGLLEAMRGRQQL